MKKYIKKYETIIYWCVIVLLLVACVGLFLHKQPQLKEIQNGKNRNTMESRTGK